MQDWGGLLGLTLPMEIPGRYAALLVMNTALATGDEPLAEGFLDWRAFSNRKPDMDIGKLMQRACPHLSDAEAAAYAAPFPIPPTRPACGAFPTWSPTAPDAGGAALSRQAEFLAQRLEGKSLMAVGMKDPVLGPPVMRTLHGLIRGCPPPLEIAEGGHFLQEWGEEIAARALTDL